MQWGKEDTFADEAFEVNGIRIEELSCVIILGPHPCRGLGFPKANLILELVGAFKLTLQSPALSRSKSHGILLAAALIHSTC